MEIVIVSDTVRQRRSRTPLPSTPMQSSTITTEGIASELPAQSTAHPKPKPKPLRMPDLLPKTFHLAETSALFSQVDKAQNLLAQSPSLTPSPTPPPPPQRKSSLTSMRRLSEHDYENEQKVSVVEIRESNLTTPKRPINTYHTRESLQSHNVGQIMNTCSILESVDYIEPCSVETVHIVDVTSEPSDSETQSSTPNRTGRNNQRESSSDDDDDDDESDANEYETGEPAIAVALPKSASMDKMRILRQQISCDESRKSLQKDRDLLKDSEIEESAQPKLSPSEKTQHLKITTALNEILRSKSKDSDRGTDSFDEPLIFSDDDDDEDAVDDANACRQNKQTADLQFNRDTVFFL